MEKFDVVVIGGGPAGYAAAMRAIDFGKRVCLIERDKIGLNANSSIPVISNFFRRKPCKSC